MAVWEVADVYGETKSVEKTAEHFRWPLVLVKRALSYAEAFPEEIRHSRKENAMGSLLGHQGGQSQAR